MRSRWTHDLPARVVLIPTLLLGVAFSPGRAQDWLPGESLRMAIFNLEVTLEVQRSALESELDRLNGEMVRREGIYAALARRFEEIRALATAADGATSGAALDQMEDEVRALEAEAASSSQRIRVLRDSVRAQEEQIQAGEQRLAELAAQLPGPSESLSGLWDVTLAPGGSRAVFALRQSGTVLAGEYLQDGGHHGSLQGTLVSGKVFMSRIDSRLGRSMELEGTVNRAGTLIRGTWQSMDVSGGRPGSGAWQARRRTGEEAEGPFPRGRPGEEPEEAGPAE